MKHRERTVLPKSRRAWRAIDLEDEVVVYDERRQRIHNLNRVAWLVLQASDGATTAEEIAASIADESELPADPRVVEVAWNRLRRAHLIEAPTPLESSGMTRRELGRRMGLGAILAASLPLITTAVLPPPAVAQSPCGSVPIGGECAEHAECASCCCRPPQCAHPSFCLS